LTRTLISVAFLIGAGLMLWQRVSIGWLGLALLPHNFITGIIGILVCAAGFVFALWARRTLGANWRGVVTLKKGHELIQRGPYRLIRNPIYTGVLMLVLGTGIVIGEVRSSRQYHFSSSVFR
jgi:protein-S-isoprenylcysteine O-methyltransferase Ste14